MTVRRKRHIPTSPIIVAIRNEALRQRLTPYALSKLSGLRISTLQCLLAGEGSPTLPTLEAAAKALRMKLVAVKLR